MKAFYADEQKRHDPKAFLSTGAPQPNPETAGARRAPACRRARRRLRHRAARRLWAGPDRRRPHAGIYRVPRNIFVRWQRIEGASAEVIPNIHPIARGRLLSRVGRRPGRLPHGRHGLPDLGRDLRQRLLERLVGGRGGRGRAGGRAPPPTRSAARPATMPLPMSPAASASSTIRPSPRSICAAGRRASRSSMSTCITATARRASSMPAPTC